MRHEELSSYLSKYPLEKLVSVFLVGAALSLPAVTNALLAAAPKGALSKSVVFGLVAVVLFLVADALSRSVAGEKAAQGLRAGVAEVSSAVKQATA